MPRYGNLGYALAPNIAIGNHSYLFILIPVSKNIFSIIGRPRGDYFLYYVDLVASSKSEATEEDMHQTFVILSLLLDSVRKLPIVVAHPELDVDIKILEMNLAQSIKEIFRKFFGLQ